MKVFRVTIQPKNPATNAVVPLLYASRHAQPDGTTDNFEPRLESIRFRFDANVDTEQLRGPVGEITLNNTDGALDSLLDLAYDNAAIVISYGNDFDPEGAFVNLATTWVAEQAESNDDRIIIRITDAYSAFFKKKIQNVTFAGTGGTEGPAALAGKKKRIAFGDVFNVPAVLVDPANNIFMLFHDFVKAQAPALSLAAADFDPLSPYAPFQVFDSGSALTNQNANYASIAAMYATAPAAGKFRYLPANASGDNCAYIRLDTKPIGQVTWNGCVVYNAGFIGSPGSAWPVTLADQWTYAFSVSAGAGGFVAIGDWNLNGLNSDPTGISFGPDDDASSKDWLSAALKSVHAWTAVSGTTIWYRWLTNPNVAFPGAAPVRPIVLPADVISKMRKVVSDPTDLLGLPSWRVRLAGGKNNLVQTTGLAVGVIGTARQTLLAEEFVTVKSEDAAVKTSYPTANDQLVETIINTRNGSTAESDRQLALLKAAPRGKYSVAANVDLFDIFAAVPGDPLTITEYKRYGCDISRTFQTLGFDVEATALDEAKGTVPATFTVWG